MKTQFPSRTPLDNESIIPYNKDVAEKAIKKYSELRMAVEFFFQQWQDGALTEETKSTFLDCSEIYLSEMIEVLGMESIINKKRQHDSETIRNKNIENRELRKQLGEKVNNTHLQEAVKNLCESFKKWWNIYGFGHTSNISILNYGTIKAVVSGMITDDYYSEEKSGKNHKRDYLKGIGFEMGLEEKDYVLCNDQNIKTLTDLLKSKYPSSEIRDITCHVYNKDGGVFRDIEINIRNLEDIQP